MKLSLRDKMPFGKYKGKTIKEIIENDPQYLYWACENIGELLELINLPKAEAKLPEKVEYKGEYSFFADLHKECFVVAEDMLIIKKELNELIDYITELRKELDYLKQSNLSN